MILIRMRRLEEVHGDRNDKEEPVYVSPGQILKRIFLMTGWLAVAWASNHRRTPAKPGKKSSSS